LVKVKKWISYPFFAVVIPQLENHTLCMAYKMIREKRTRKKPQYIKVMFIPVILQFLCHKWYSLYLSTTYDIDTGINFAYVYRILTLFGRHKPCQVR